jgi:acyl carrier protein
MAGWRLRTIRACCLGPASRSRLGLDHWKRNQTVISAPSRTEILDDLIAVLDRDLGVQSSSPITEDTRFFADLGLASIDAVVLSERLQEHYGRSLPFQELMAEMGRRTERDLSIGELVAFLATNL